MRILLVEDHADSADVLGRVLRSKGHCVVSAATGSDALRLCVEHTFDLLIADIGLPDVDGWELLHRVREKCSIRSIALSAYAMISDIEKSRAAGFEAHLTKPISVAQLIEAVDSMMATAHEKGPVG